MVAAIELAVRVSRRKHVHPSGKENAEEHCERGEREFCFPLRGIRLGDAVSPIKRSSSGWASGAQDALRCKSGVQREEGVSNVNCKRESSASSPSTSPRPRPICRDVPMPKLPAQTYLVRLGTLRSASSLCSKSTASWSAATGSDYPLLGSAAVHCRPGAAHFCSVTGGE